MLQLPQASYLFALLRTRHSLPQPPSSSRALTSHPLEPVTTDTPPCPLIPPCLQATEPRTMVETAAAAAAAAAALAATAAPAAKQAKTKKPKVSKPKVAPAHPPVAQMVKTAIAALKERNG